MDDVYISKSAARASILYEDPNFVYAIDRVPAADVRENKHGKWKVHYPLVTCSVCNNTMEIVTQMNFCPNCGADMREE